MLLKKKIHLAGRSKKLSNQLSLIIAAMLTLVFALFIMAAVYMSSCALTNAISSDFSSVSEKNAARVQSTFDAASSLGQDLQFYMNGMYETYDRQVESRTIDQTLVKSDVCGQDILANN